MIDRARATPVLVLLVLGLVAGAPPPRAEACCMAARMGWQVLVPESTTIAPTDAPVLGLRNIWSSAPPLPQAERAEALTVVLASGSRVQARLETLAPGLARLVPPAPWPAGEHQVEGASGRTSFRVDARATSAAPPAPVVRELTREERHEVRSGTIVNVRATLGAPIPPGVVAVIATPVGSRDRGSWAEVREPSTSPLVYEHPGRCGAHAEHHEPPVAGESVVISFVDAGGHRSAPSAPVTAR